MQVAELALVWEHASVHNRQNWSTRGESVLYQIRLHRLGVDLRVNLQQYITHMKRTVSLRLVLLAAPFHQGRRALRRPFVPPP
jgi:hypothetical protein